MKNADILIIGSGLGGLLLSILLFDQGAYVTLASKSDLTNSNTSLAQGGLAAVTPQALSDRWLDHLADTISSGAGLTDLTVAREIIKAAPRLVSTLTELGVVFDRAGGGQYELAKEGGHSQARVLHSKDTTGRTIVEALHDHIRTRAQKDPARLAVLDHCSAFDLLISDNQILGAKFIRNGHILQINSNHVALATGGAGQIFSRTTNPTIATADGIALAYRAGAALCDLEFMQFHPTALNMDNAPPFLISEAARGAGAVLVDSRGRPFMKRFHKDADLATRDVVSRAIHTVITEENVDSVGLDLRPIGNAALMARFPNIVATCRTFGIDPASEPIPVAPAAHYYMGGVLADSSGYTTVNGLYAIGEVASTGFHGANRLASNSLLEAGVMAINLASQIERRKRSFETDGVNKVTRDDSAPKYAEKAHKKDQPRLLPSSLTKFQSMMYKHASLIRTENSLNQLIGWKNRHRAMPGVLDVESICAANILLVGGLLATAAIQRRESRGAHWRADFPGRDFSLDNPLYCRRLAVAGNQWYWLESGAHTCKIDKLPALTA